MAEEGGKGVSEEEGGRGVWQRKVTSGVAEEGGKEMEDNQ